MDLRQQAIQTAQQYGIPPDMFLRQIAAESAWNPNAVSPAGAEGLLQIMPGTQDYLGVTDPFSPQQSLDAGARYMAEQYKKFGDWNLALAAYNAGPGRVTQYGGIPPFTETQNYVAKIMGTAPLPSGPSGAPPQVQPMAPMTPPAPVNPMEGLSPLERLLSSQGFDQSKDASPLQNIWNAVQGRKTGAAPAGLGRGLLAMLGVG